MHCMLSTCTCQIFGINTVVSRPIYLPICELGTDVTMKYNAHDRHSYYLIFNNLLDMCLLNFQA